MRMFSVFKVGMGNITIKAVITGFYHGEKFPKSPMHNHAAFEFLFFMRGSAMLKTENDSLILEEKDSVLIAPETFHSLIPQGEDTAVMSFTFFIEGNQKKSGADYEKLVREKLKGENNITPFYQNNQIGECLGKIAANIYSESIVAEDIIKAELVLLFSEIFSHFEEEKGEGNDYEKNASEYDTRAFMIEEYFNEHYKEDISLEELARSLYLSEKQTERMIKNAFGEGFRQHLKRIRLLIAQRLLTDTEKEIKEIAEEVGYQSYNGFYLAFKKTIGITPENYREKNKKE